MSDKKKPYKATSPIKLDGKRYEIGDTLNLTEDQADRLHVEPTGGEEDESSKKADKSKPKVSTAMNAKPAIKMIEDTPYEELEGFVTEDEKRSTVVDAWEEKTAAAEGAEKEPES